jgi:hypothetical protein
MITQMSNLHTVRRAVFFLLLIFFVACGRNGGSGGRARAADGPAEPGAAVSEEAPVETTGPVAYDVYFDNSASMDGYLAGPGTDLKNDVHALLKDLQTHGIADTINLGYVNERICPYRFNASPLDVNGFIKTLNHDSLVRNPCGRKDSYIDAMLQQVIGANPDHVHVLISDFVFSVGRGASADLLRQQGDNVETVLATALRKRDFSTIVLKFSSGFDGTYYVESRGGGNGSAVSVQGIRRPYYVMIFGSVGKIRRLVDFIKGSPFVNYSGFKEACYLFQPGGMRPSAKLVRKDRIGDFVIAEPATRLVLTKAVADSTSFQFAVALNLDAMKQDRRYLEDAGNYELPRNYVLTRIMKNEDPTDQAMQGFTHIFLVRTDDLKPQQDVSIRLTSKIPDWVYKGSTMDDAHPMDTIEQKKTFGFSYLLEGISRAYADKYKNMDQFALDVRVSEMGEAGEGGGGRGGIPWVLILGVVVVVGLVVVIKFKR